MTGIADYFEYKEGKVFWKKSKGSRGVVGEQFGSYDGRYQHGMFNKKMYREHQLVWFLHHGYIPKTVDHIDNNPLNNNIKNLREVSRSENMMNASLRKDSKTGVKNVIFDKNRNKYRVDITANKQKIYLGRFDDLELAELVAEMGREKYHGNFARSF